MCNYDECLCVEVVVVLVGCEGYCSPNNLVLVNVSVYGGYGHILGRQPERHR